MYKLAIEDIVEIPVKFTLKARKVNKTFAFVLIGTRKEQSFITERFKEVEFKYAEFMQTEGLITGWEDQRLVLTTDDKPADFGPEAFAKLLNTQGVAQQCFEAYQKECGAKQKN